jgi:putative MATE family efflux protein
MLSLFLDNILLISLVSLAYIVAFTFRNKLKNKTKLTSGFILSSMIKYAIPLILGSFFSMFYTVVDTIVVGRFLGVMALAAVGVSGMIIWFAISFFFGMGMAVNTIVSQYFGAGRMNDVKKAVDASMFISFVSGLTVGIIGILMAKPILVLLQTPASVLPEAIIYTRIFMGGIVLFALYDTSRSVLQSSGDTITPFTLLLISSLVNIILDIVFVQVFHWGIAGVAYASIIAQATALTGILIHLHSSKHSAITFKAGQLILDKAMIWLFIKTGTPAGLQQTMASVGFMLQSSLINSFGASATAAYAAIARADGLLMLPANGLNGTISTFVGQNLGANNKKRAMAGFKQGTLLSIVSTTIIVSLAIVFRENLMLIFIKPEEVEAIAIGMNFISIVMISYPLMALTFAFFGAMRASGDMTAPLIVSVIGLWGVRLPLAYWLSRDSSMGLNGVWVAAAAQWSIMGFISVIYYFWRKPLNRKFIKN